MINEPQTEPRNDISIPIVKHGRMFNLRITATKKGIKAIVSKGTGLTFYVVGEKQIFKVCVLDIQDWAESVINSYKIDK